MDKTTIFAPHPALQQEVFRASFESRRLPLQKHQMPDAQCLQKFQVGASPICVIADLQHGIDALPFLYLPTPDSTSQSFDNSALQRQEQYRSRHQPGSVTASSWYVPSSYPFTDGFNTAVRCFRL